MAEPKTRKTGASVADFLNAVEPASLREDAWVICRLLTEITGEEPAMWGPTIVGFGETPYTNTTGTYNWPTAGFSPRKPQLTIYIGEGFDSYTAQLEKLGPHKIGKSCLYIRRLSAIDLDVLTDMLRTSFQHCHAKPE